MFNLSVDLIRNLDSIAAYAIVTKSFRMLLFDFILPISEVRVNEFKGPTAKMKGYSNPWLLVTYPLNYLYNFHI